MTVYEEAKKLIDQGNYQKAYLLLKQIVNNIAYSAEDRSDALNMLGVIATCYFLDLNEYEDESGLPYFKKAIEIYSENIGALSNILNSFGKETYQHRDSKSFVEAFDTLNKLVQNQQTSKKHILKNILDELIQKKLLYNQTLEEVK